MNIQLTLRAKLLLGFGTITLLVMLMAGIIFISSGNVDRYFDRLADKKFPLSTSLQSLTTHLSTSLSALRGQIILGGDPIEKQKFLAQQDVSLANITAEQKKIRRLLVESELPTSNLNELDNKITELLVAFKEVSDIANEPANIPALQILVEQAMPLADQMLVELQKIAELESEEDADEDRKELFINISGSRATFATAVGNLRAYLLTQDAEYQSRFNTQWLTNADHFEVIIDDYEEYLSEDQFVHWEKYSELREQFAPLTINIFELYERDDNNIANYLLATKIEPLIGEIEVVLQEQSARARQSVKDSQVSLTEAQKELVWKILVVSLVVIVISIIISVTISRYLDSNIQELMERSFAISAGDLVIEKEIELQDAGNEFERLEASFNSMARALSSMIKIVKTRSYQSKSSAQYVASLADQIQRSADKEKQNSDEISEALQLFNEIQQDSQNIIQQAQEELSDSIELANSGSKATIQNLREMDKSVETVELASTKVASLKKATDKISDVTSSINEIADQINLISLNAAIEAARAGEHGRGFAVVAEEVRNLAQRTSNSTTEIKKVIDELGKIVGEVQSGITEIVSQVDKSKQSSIESDQALQTMMQSMDKVVQENHTLVNHADKQSAGLESLRDKIDQLLQSLHQNSRQAKMVNGISERLNQAVESVNYSLSHFQFEEISAAKQCKDLVFECQIKTRVLAGDHVFDAISNRLATDMVEVHLDDADMSDFATVKNNSEFNIELFIPNDSTKAFMQQKPLLLKAKLLSVNSNNKRLISYNVISAPGEYISFITSLRAAMPAGFDAKGKTNC